MLIAYAIAMRDLQKKFQGKPVYEIGRDEFFALEDKVFEDRLLVILEEHCSSLPSNRRLVRRRHFLFLDNSFRLVVEGKI